MKKIYLVLTSPNTLASQVIRKFSKNELSHVGISFDKDLKEIYSFSRKYVLVSIQVVLILKVLIQISIRKV